MGVPTLRIRYARGVSGGRNVLTSLRDVPLRTNLYAMFTAHVIDFKFYTVSDEFFISKTEVFRKQPMLPRRPYRHYLYKLPFTILIFSPNTYQKDMLEE